eukprot:scaffold83_cov181-Amphora_coffeaeformis.AAC.20
MHKNQDSASVQRGSANSVGSGHGWTMDDSTLSLTSTSTLKQFCNTSLEALMSARITWTKIPAGTPSSPTTSSRNIKLWDAAPSAP